MLGLARDKLTHHDYMFNVVTSFVCMRVFIHFGMLLIPSSGSQSWLPARVVAVVCVCVCACGSPRTPNEDEKKLLFMDLAKIMPQVP